MQPSAGHDSNLFILTTKAAIRNKIYGTEPWLVHLVPLNCRNSNLSAMDRNMEPQSDAPTVAEMDPSARVSSVESKSQFSAADLDTIPARTTAKRDT